MNEHLKTNQQSEITPYIEEGQILVEPERLVYDSTDTVILTGYGNPQLAHTVGNILNTDVHNPVSNFLDGETRVKIPVNVRSKHVIVMDSGFPQPNQRLAELKLMISAARQAAAGYITAAIPYFPYARQDRKDQARVPISGAEEAREIEHRGANAIMSFDIHAEQLQGAVRIPWDNLYGSIAILPMLRERNLLETVVASPDRGGVPRATAFAHRLGIPRLAIGWKQRDVNLNDKSQAIAMVGDVRNRDVVMVDDIFATGGTLMHFAELAKDQGANRIIAATTHGLFLDSPTNSCLEALSNSAIDEVIVTDTIQHREEILQHPKITVATIAPLFAEAIYRNMTGQSISELFNGIPALPSR